MNERVELRQGAVPPSDEPEHGLVIGVESSRVRVRLVSGVVGFVANPSTNGSPLGLDLGQRGVFRVRQRLQDGELELDLVSMDDPPPQAFDRDVTQLQEALRVHRGTSIPQEAHASVPTMDEQRVQSWVHRADKCLARLKKNRSDRLDDEFRSRT